MTFLSCLELVRYEQKHKESLRTYRTNIPVHLDKLRFVQISTDLEKPGTVSVFFESIKNKSSNSVGAIAAMVVVDGLCLNEAEIGLYRACPWPPFG